MLSKTLHPVFLCVESPRNTNRLQNIRAFIVFMFVLCVCFMLSGFLLLLVCCWVSWGWAGGGGGGGVGGRCMCVGGGTSNYVIIIYANLVMGWAGPNKCPLFNNKCHLFNNKCPLFNNKCPLFNNKCQSAESLCDTCVRLKALYVQYYNNTQTNLIIHYISCISHTLPRIHTR